MVAADPEVPDADAGFRTTIEASGFRPIEEIQPSRHRITLALDGRTEEEVFASVSKSTRQRIRKAEETVAPVVRHDARVAAGGPGRRVREPSEPPDLALDRFYDLLARDRRATAFLVRPGRGLRRLVDDRRSRPATSSTSRRGDPRRRPSPA